MSKFATVKWKLLAVIFAVLIVCAQPARALAIELRIQNDFNNRLHVAVIYYDQTYKRWRTQGWFTAEPRRERIVTFDTSYQVIYLFAELAGRNLTWGRGDAQKTVISEAFSYYDGQNCPNGTRRLVRNFTKYTSTSGVVYFRPRS